MDRVRSIPVAADLLWPELDGEGGADLPASRRARRRARNQTTRRHRPLRLGGEQSRRGYARVAPKARVVARDRPLALLAQVVAREGRLLVQGLLLGGAGAEGTVNERTAARAVERWPLSSAGNRQPPCRGRLLGVVTAMTTEATGELHRHVTWRGMASHALE